jgi:hypothetical protein
MEASEIVNIAYLLPLGTPVKVGPRALSSAAENLAVGMEWTTGLSRPRETQAN